MQFDWTRVRAFLATAEEGSFSAAARRLGMAQPTLGRQVAALEEELGVALFERGPRGPVLTETGAALLPHARAMGEAAAALSLGAAGRSQSVEGLVRLSATATLAVHVLPPLLTRLRAAAPGIEIELSVSNDIADLRRREADLALRHARSVDPDLIARRLADQVAHFYASEDFLARRGPIADPASLARGPLLGFESNGPWIEALRGMGIPVRADSFALRTDSHVAQWQMARAGMGIGIMLEEVGAADPGMRRAAPWMAPFVYELWLVAHRELRTSARVRLVFDFLAEALARRRSRG